MPASPKPDVRPPSGLAIDGLTLFDAAVVRRTLLALGLGLAQSILPARAAVPDGYPSSYGAIVSAARDEGKVVVYSTTDL